jgi:hypothetical protein
MRKLDSVIAQFVGDLLRTIGEASVDDLRELFAGRPESEKFSPLPVDFATPVRFAPLAPSAPARPAAPTHAARGEPRAHAARRRSAVLLSTTASGSFAPPGALDITDPESLLSLGGPDRDKQTASRGTSLSSLASLSNGAHADSTMLLPSRARAHALLEVRERATPTDARTSRHTEPDVESPASGVRPLGSGSTVKLSDNETLARVSNSGVVIRRKKRA